MALKNNMVSVSVENVEKKRKKYRYKCCAAVKCNNRSDNQPDLSFHAFPKDLKTRKEWEHRMRRGDVLHFKSVDHKFCCSEHFHLTDFKVFNISCAHREEAKHSMEKNLQDLDWPMPLKESLVDYKTVKFFGPPALGESVGNLKTEVEHLKEELSKAKEKEHIFRFGLKRFSSSPEDS